MWIWTYLLCSASAVSFLSTWQITAAPETIKLNLISREEYSVINWGDDTESNFTSGTVTHEYRLSGTYNVSITGLFSGFNFRKYSLNALNLKSIYAWGGFSIDYNTTVNFANCANLKLYALDQPIMVSNVSLQSFFANCSSLDSPIDWDIENVTGMKGMFSFAASFNSPVTFRNSHNVRDVSFLFSSCPRFNKAVDFSSTKSVIDAQGMFKNASSFDQTLRFNFTQCEKMDEFLHSAISFNSPLLLTTPTVVSFASFLHGASSFNQPVNFDTRNAVSFSLMFAGASLFNQSVSFDASKVITTANMFQDASSFNRPINFSTSNKLTHVGGMFNDATTFNSSIILNTTLVVDMSSMFAGASLFDQYIPFDVSSVEKTDYMFSRAHSFNQPIKFSASSKLQTVTNMFNGATNFNNVVIMNTSLVGQFLNMFAATSSFNQPLVFDTTSLRDLAGMFYQASAYNMPLSFDTSKVTGFYRTFMQAESFNQSLDTLDFSSAIGMESFLEHATSFNQNLNLNTVNAKHLARFLKGATSFNSLISLNLSTVTNMSEFLSGAIRFNQTLMWNTRNVQDMNFFFAGASAFQQNLADWPVDAVHNCSKFCDSCSLPTFPNCSPCASSVKSTTKGYRVCNCPASERTATSTQCGLVDSGCPSCNIIVNSTGEAQTVAVGDAKNPVSVNIPSSLLNSSNVSLRIVLVALAVDSGKTLLAPAGDYILSIVLQKNGLDQTGINLTKPIQFVIPFSQIAQCQSSINPRCVWWDGTTWIDSGCTSAVIAGGTQCTCTHLTDFAVLLSRVPDACGKVEEFTTLYYPFSVLYALILLYCLLVIGALLLAQRQQTVYNKALIVHHLLIAAVACLRFLSCLQFLDVLGNTQGSATFFTAAPYIFEYFLFTRLAGSWIGLAHFTMLSGDAQWVKIRPVFLVVNVLGSLCVIGVFAAFALDKSEVAAIVGASVLASFHIGLAIIFQFYSYSVVKQIRKVPSSSSTSQSTTRCDIADKLQWVGRGVTYCFVVQAVTGIVAVSAPHFQLELWTALFLLFNVLALVCLLFVYFAAVRKEVTEVSKRVTRSSRSFEI